MTYIPERARRHAVLSVRRFHRQLIEAGLVTAPPPFEPPPPSLDRTGSFGRRQQAENVAPPTLGERLRNMLLR